MVGIGNDQDCRWLWTRAKEIDSSLPGLVQQQLDRWITIEKLKQRFGLRCRSLGSDPRPEA